MNTKVQVRNLKNNKVVLLVISCEPEISLEHCIAAGDIYGTSLKEHKLFRQTSATLQMYLKQARRIYYSFTSKETGKTLDIIIPVYNNSLCVKGSPNSKFHAKIPNSLCLYIINYIDTKHAKVKKAALREIYRY